MKTVSGENGRQIVYAEYGQPDGAPVVFLHGTPGSHRFGALLDSAAQECGIRILAPSRPGYSLSSPWPRRSLRDAAASILPVLDDVNIGTAGLIGFSGGGPHALVTAASHPHRITRVDLISSATPPELSAETPLLQRLLGGFAIRTPTALRGLFRGQAWIAPHVDPSFIVDQYTTDGTTISDGTADIIRADFCEAFAHHRSGAVADLRNTAADWGIDYEAMTPTTRIWHGRKDTNVPIGDARRFERELPDAELCVAEHTDHLQTLLQTTSHLLETHR